MLSSSHLASFDGSKCNTPLTGHLRSSNGQTVVFRRLDALSIMPGPDVSESGSANHAYYVWVQKSTTRWVSAPMCTRFCKQQQSATPPLGLTASSSIPRIPYPLASSARMWTDIALTPAGHSMWTTTGTRAYFPARAGKAWRAKGVSGQNAAIPWRTGSNRTLYRLSGVFELAEAPINRVRSRRRKPSVAAPARLLRHCVPA